MPIERPRRTIRASFRFLGAHQGEVFCVKRIRWSAAIALATGFVLFVVAGAPARTTVQIHTMKASTYQSNGDLIQGWHWLRNSGNTAQWTFNVAGLQSALKNSVYLNMTGLVTKGINGGSGYSGGLNVQFVGGSTTNFSVYLTNPFRPKELSYMPTGHTQGIGYTAYGAVKIPTSAYQGAATLQVIVSRSSTSVRGNLHIAVSKDSPLLAYLTAGGV
jgi:hypothetical protein